MKKILVATDLSNASKPALRLAIQLSSLNGYGLTFFHSYHILRPTSWSDIAFVSFEKSESTKITRKLRSFVNNVYKSMGIEMPAAVCIATPGLYPDKEIMKYASTFNYEIICVGRKGSGKTANLFGSMTTRLIQKSEIPVLIVPEKYRRASISNIIYLSDLVDVENELKEVTAFADPLNAKVELLHFEDKYTEDASWLNSAKDNVKKLKVKAHYEQFDYSKRTIEIINEFVKRKKCSMLIMFTFKKRNMFEKIFMPSVSADFASTVSVPMLVLKQY